jgi:hypothetical protein
MNIVEISQIIGTVSILFLFSIDFYIGATERHFQKSGRKDSIALDFHLCLVSFQLAAALFTQLCNH